MASFHHADEMTKQERKKWDAALENLKEINPSIVNKYDKSFDANNIYVFNNEGISPEEANENYVNTRFRERSLNDLLWSKIPLDIAQKYPEELDGWEISVLYGGNVDSKKSQRFLDLNRKYGSKISVQDMAFFQEKEIPYEEVEKNVKNTFSKKIDEQIQERIQN